MSSKRHHPFKRFRRLKGLRALSEGKCQHLCLNLMTGRSGVIPATENVRAEDDAPAKRSAAHLSLSAPDRDSALGINCAPSLFMPHTMGSGFLGNNVPTALVAPCLHDRPADHQVQNLRDGKRCAPDETNPRLRVSFSGVTAEM